MDKDKINKIDKEVKKIKEPIELQFYHLKKKLLIAAMFLRFFFCGAEYSVILPTALIYLKSLDANHAFMGLVVAVYPLAAMLALPVVGYIYDRTRRTKELLLILNGFEIVGNLLYALPYSKWLPLSGRFLAGFGDGFLSLAVGEFTYLYSGSTRIAIFSILELGRVVGLILGPSLNLFIANKSITVQGWVLDSKTLPGALMAINWCIMQIITVVCVHNLALESGKLIESDQGEKVPLIESDMLEKEDVIKEENFKIQMIADREEMDNRFFGKQTPSNKGNSESQHDLLTTLKDLMHWEFLIIFLNDLMLWMGQTVFEIFLPYITEFDYHWTPASTGFIYMIGGIELIVVFGIMMGTTGKIRDTTLIALALILTQVSLGLLILESSLKDLRHRFIVFVFTCLVGFAVVPLNLVCSKTLITKLVPPERQGTVQGIYSSATRLALLGGPLIGSVAFEQRIVYGSISSVLCFLTILSWYHSLNRIHAREEKLTKELALKELSNIK